MTASRRPRPDRRPGPAGAPPIAIDVGGLRVEIVRKAIRHLHLRVLAPAGLVRVSTPLWVDDDAVRRMVGAKRDWIRRQQARLADRPPVVPAQMLSGEHHDFRGRRYCLQVIETGGAPRVQLGAGLELYVRTGTGIEQRAAILREWYRRQLQAVLPDLIARWEAAIGVRVAAWGVKRMRTRWGSCNVVTRRIWLNLELARHPPEHLEYVVVHELLHLLEAGHGARFKALMDVHLPSWRTLRRDLRRFGSESHAQSMFERRGEVRAGEPEPRSARRRRRMPE